MTHVNILCFGDVVGRPGRLALASELPQIRETFRADIVIVNGENAAGGVGIDAQTADEIRAAGADVVTLGDHTWQKKEMRTAIEPRAEWLIRPANFPQGAPGRGYAIKSTARGTRIGVLNVMGRVFIPLMLDCPFGACEDLLTGPLAGCDCIVADVHAEATSEKGAFGHHFDGRVHLVVGTHTHVQTADERILPQGTGFISDLGMTGVQDGVIGMDAKVAAARFLTGLPQAYELAKGAPVISGIFVNLTFD